MNFPCIHAFSLVAFVAASAAGQGAVDTTKNLSEIRENLDSMGEHRFVYRIFFKLYDASFSTDAPTGSTTSQILSGDYAMHLEFDYLRKIPKSVVLESSDAILRNNMVPREFDEIETRVNLLNEAYRTVTKGDSSALTYLPGAGTNAMDQ